MYIHIILYYSLFNIDSILLYYYYNSEQTKKYSDITFVERFLNSLIIDKQKNCNVT